MSVIAMGPRLFGRFVVMVAAVVMLVAALLCAGHHHHESAVGLHTATTTATDEKKSLAQVDHVESAPVEADHHDHEHAAMPGDIHIAETSPVRAVSLAHHDHECGPGGLPSAVAPPPVPPAVPELDVLAVVVAGEDVPLTVPVVAGLGAAPPVAGTQLLTRVCVARR